MRPFKHFLSWILVTALAPAAVALGALHVASASESGSDPRDAAHSVPKAGLIVSRPSAPSPGRDAAAKQNPFTGRTEDGREITSARLQADRALQEGYTALAAALARRTNGESDSQYFARKALAASRGEGPAPEQLIAWQVPSGPGGRLSQVRARLLHVHRIVRTRGLEQQLLVDLARLQVAFDCTVAELEYAATFGPDTACRTQLAQRLSHLELTLAARLQPQVFL